MGRGAARCCVVHRTPLCLALLAQSPSVVQALLLAKAEPLHLPLQSILKDQAERWWGGSGGWGLASEGRGDNQLTRLALSAEGRECLGLVMHAVRRQP